MRLLRLFFVLFPIALLIDSGCSNDLDLVLPAPPIPNIYCIVNPKDSFCYLTISKTVQPKNDLTGAIDNNDQLRVDDAKIVLEVWGDGYPLWSTTFSLMEETSIAGQNLQKSRSCYKSDKMLQLQMLSIVGDYGKGPYDYFRLLVSSPHFENMAYAKIPFIKMPFMAGPYTTTDFNLYGQEYSNLNVKVILKQIKYGSLSCRFYYEDYTDHWEQKSVQFIVQKDVVLLDQMITMRIYEEFFNKLVSAIPDEPEVYARKFNHMDFRFTASDVYFHDYYSTYINASNFDMPTYSNITNAYGILSMTGHADFPPLHLDKQSLDSLCHGRITKQLRFRNDL